MVRTLYRLGSLCGPCGLAAGPTDRRGPLSPASYMGPGTEGGLYHVRKKVFLGGDDGT